MERNSDRKADGFSKSFYDFFQTYLESDSEECALEKQIFKVFRNILYYFFQTYLESVSLESVTTHLLPTLKNNLHNN